MAKSRTLQHGRFSFPTGGGPSLIGATVSLVSVRIQRNEIEVVRMDARGRDTAVAPSIESQSEPADDFEPEAGIG
jgi:hypothetical protein